MVDNPSPEPPVPAPAGPKPKSAFVTFLTSPAGKLIVGGLLLFVLLVVAGSLTFFFLINTGSKPTVVVAPQGPSGSTTTTPTAAPTNPPEQPLDETFTFRNIFAPTVKPATTTESDSSDGSDTTSETANGPEDTLILKSIHSESGEYVATFEWNGQIYETREGEQVDNSPWEVVTIYSDSVVMLYGDSKITLAVGQGFSDGGVISK